MAAPAKRIDGIDFWRGFGLLTIFIDHVPENVFQHVTQQNFGFSDAAELFVFLSGVSVALAADNRRHFGTPPSTRKRQHLAALYRAVADDAVAAGAGAPRRSADARSLGRDLSSGARVLSQFANLAR